MLWQPAPVPRLPRRRTPRRHFGQKPTFRARVKSLFEHLTAVNAPLVAYVFGMTTRLAGIHLSQLVERGDLVRVPVASRRYRTEYRWAS